MSKLPESPTKATFITQFKYITSVSKLMFKQIECYNKQSPFFSGVMSAWKIFNNKTITEDTHKNSKLAHRLLL